MIAEDSTGVEDRRVAKVIQQCEKLKSRYLFSYREPNGDICSISARDVNDYLREIAGKGAQIEITAKALRTWWGSVACLDALVAHSENMTKTARKRAISQAVKVAAELLGNTPAVCRRSYIHPQILTTFEAGELHDRLQVAPASKWPELNRAENQFARLISN